MTGFLDRRAFLAAIAAGGMALGLGGGALARSPIRLVRAIPGTDERVPVIGMGSWITFDVGDDEAELARRVEVLRTFFDLGGAVVDSSPMYGTSETVIGRCLERLANDDALFAATKVWTPFQWHGRQQMATSEKLWGRKRLDLIQVHNLLGWEGHLETLLARKAQGRVRYVGITTSHGQRHDDFAQVMAARPIDFVQFTYNILDREAERHLLPLAAERGLAVIVNRPFRRGDLIERLARHPLPPWAAEFDGANWPQFLLKFIVSHPAVTCAIPATSRADHMRQNMGAAWGRLPNAKLRRRMIAYVESL